SPPLWLITISATTMMSAKPAIASSWLRRAGFMRSGSYVGRSREEPLSDEAALLDPGWDREDGARCVLDVLVERVAAEVALDRRELLRVALEADEEEAGVELGRDLVEAVGERVAAPKDPGLRFLGRGEPDVGVVRDHGIASLAGAEVR